ncbi:hypothetical protein PAPYR_7107 [Paratrimastix pyriformis]|uniref:Uncharacterized protein n=1 Tax=Paratrimastix pyriformis TaxID=342808 RepID=A0ABQ8UDT0_9EUKA|nr:hypothetical protein PAPYR_7107 [Paratrimastix pyriformis]
MHIAEENHLSDFQVHFLKEHAQCGKREVFLEFFNRAEEDDLVFHDLDHISTFKNSMLDEFCKLFGHLGFSSGALPSSTLLKGIIESLQNVFLRVPINVVGDRDVSIPDSPFRVRSRSPKHADARGFASPSAKKAARTEATSTRKLPASPPAREVTPPCLRPPCRLGAGPRTVYVCYTHARWYVGSKPPPFRPF